MVAVHLWRLAKRRLHPVRNQVPQAGPLGQFAHWRIVRAARLGRPWGLSGVVVAVDCLLASPGELEQAFDGRAGSFNHRLIDDNLVAPLLKQG